MHKLSSHRSELTLALFPNRDLIKFLYFFSIFCVVIYKEKILSDLLAFVGIGRYECVVKERIRDSPV